MKHHRTILQSASIVSFFTILSRVSGLLRDMVVSNLLGTSHSADALYIAYRIPNLLRRLTAEGAVSAAFIPVFTEEVDRNGKERAMQIANTCFYLVSLAMAIAAILGVIFSPAILTIYAFGFKGTAGKMEVAILLSRIMFPYMLLISISALGMGVLNSVQVFAPSAAGPIFLNLSMISCAYLLSPLFKERAIAIAIGVVIGGLLQVLIQVPALRQQGFSFVPQIDWHHPAIRKMGKLILPGLFGIGITQINVFIDSAFGSMLGEGAVAALYTSDRLMEFLLGVYTIALATAILPTLSRFAVQGEWREFSRTFYFGMRLVTFLTLPATIGLIFLRYPIIQLLFQRGKFNTHSSELTALPLLCFSFGLLAFSSLKLITPAFYAQRNTHTPVKSATCALVINVVANILLLRPMGVGGPALATSLAAYVNCLSLYWILRRNLDREDEIGLFKTILKSALAVIPMGAWLYYSAPTIFALSPHRAIQLVCLGFCIMIAIAIYLLNTLFLGCVEAKELLHFSPLKGSSKN